MPNNIDLFLLHLLNGSQSLQLDQLMLILTNGLTWIPFYIALFILVLKNNESMTQIFIIVGCCALAVLFTAGIDNLLVKPFVGRPRPSLDPYVKYTIDVVCNYRERDFSFFSAHAANTSCLAAFMIMLVRNRAFTIMMVAWALLNSFTRLYLGVHYPSDVACGILFGVCMGLAGYFVHLKLYFKVTPHFRYISEAYTRTGYSISDLDISIATFAFTLVYAIIRSLLT